jgi:hypothetical protein
VPHRLVLTSALASVALVAATLAGTAGGAPAVAEPSPATTPTVPKATTTATSFLLPAAARGAQPPAQRSVAGPSSLVTLRTGLLPERAEGQSLRFDLGRRAVVGTVDHVETTSEFTTWSGPLDVAEGSFTIARAGSAYRVSVRYPGETYAVTQAAGDLYWLTDVAAYGADEGHDTDEPTATELRAAERAQAAQASRDALAKPKRKKKRQVKITVLYGYDKGAKKQAGSKDAITATIGVAFADTQAALRNSGIKVKLFYRGAVQGKGKAHPRNTARNLSYLERRNDRRFDNLLVLQRKRKADLVQMIVGGTGEAGCGIANSIPHPRYAYRERSYSVAVLACVDQLTPAHELGHNLGAQHNRYPGISNSSLLRYAAGYVDVPHQFITVMSYWTPCYDAGVNCTRIPYFSSPKGTWNGLPIGSRKADNSKAIRVIAPKVARYR